MTNDYIFNDDIFSMKLNLSSYLTFLIVLCNIAVNGSSFSIEGKLKLEQLVKLLCENPSKIFGIKNKGYIKKDFDADLTIVDLNKKILIENSNIESKCKWTPFNGLEFKGTPIATIINGKIKMKYGEIIGNPEGQPIIF